MCLVPRSLAPRQSKAEEGSCFGVLAREPELVGTLLNRQLRPEGRSQRGRSSFGVAIGLRLRGLLFRLGGLPRSLRLLPLHIGGEEDADLGREALFFRSERLEQLLGRLEGLPLLGEVKFDIAKALELLHFRHRVLAGETNTEGVVEAAPDDVAATVGLILAVVEAAKHFVSHAREDRHVTLDVDGHLCDSPSLWRTKSSA